MSENNIKPSRRQFLGTAGLVGAGAVLASCAPAIATPGKANLDTAVLNFALNLEYLEAAFYLAAVGRLSEIQAIGGNAAIILPTGTNSKQPAFNGNTRMNFTSPAVSDYADEIAQDELNHVLFLRKVLGSAAVDRPVLDIGPAFANAAKAATGADAALTFSPYSNIVNGTANTPAGDLYFLHGAFIFEDVGVTAYKGAARLITDDSENGVLESAAGILAVEAYHAAEVRTILYANKDAQTGYGVDVKTLIGAISALRATLGGGKDQGLVVNNKANIVPTDANSVAFSRTTREVLNIVYGAKDAASGLFFPNGLLGAIK